MSAKIIRNIVRHRRNPNTIVWPARTAIRSFCLECMGYQQAEVARCEATDCHFWPYRTGKNPKQEAEKG